MAIAKITPTNEKNTCMAGQSCQFQFSVSNSSGVLLKYGLQIRADDGVGDWISVDGGAAEIELADGVNTTVSVTASPPADLLSESDSLKNHTFRLRVYDVDEPEKTADSASVTVTVKPAKAGEKKSLLWLWILIGVVVLAVAGLVVWMLLPGEKMPDLVGEKYYGKLEKELKDKNFAVNLTITKQASRDGSGVILKQEPEAGVELEADNEGVIAIDLTVSPILEGVPDLSGLTYSAAQSKLRSLGFGSERKTEEVSGFRSGLIFKQSPAPGSITAKGAKITLYEAVAPKVKVPNLTGLTYSAAESNLKALGLGVAKKTEVTSRVKTGSVIRQSPAANTTVTQGTAVTLYEAAPYTVCLFEHSNYKGWEKCYSSNQSNFVSLGINDRVSSLKVKKGVTAELYQHTNYGGYKVTYTSDSSWIGNKYNDQFSSLKIKSISSIKLKSPNLIQLPR